MKRLELSIILSLVAIFLVKTFFLQPQVLNFRVDPSLMDRYFNSQDIPHEVESRVFLSDSDVYLATGLLYANGEDPSLYNFEHPPVIKYLFGFSLKYLNNPLIVQMIFGVMLIVLEYLLVKKVSSSISIALFSTLLLSLDPLLGELTSTPLLDLGQTVFALLYVYLFLYSDNIYLQGILLALFAGTKFWITPLFFMALLFLYKFIRRELKLKKYVAHVLVALAVYSLFYTRSFILQGTNFNIVWHMLRTLKYRLVHNTSSFFGASIVLYTTSYWKTWWGEMGWTRSQVWSIFWPISLLTSVFLSARSILAKSVNPITLLTIVPVSYLLFLGVEAPFPRYFFIILPFAYFSLVYYLFRFISLDKSSRVRS